MCERKYNLNNLGRGLRKMKAEDYSKLAKTAEMAVKDLKGSIKEKAFEIILNNLIDNSLGKKKIEKVSSKTPFKRKKEKLSQEIPDNPVQRLMLQEIDLGKYPPLDRKSAIGRNKALARGLWTLYVALKEINQDGLTSFQTAEILTKYFRIPTTYQSLQYAFKTADRKLVNKIKKGKGYYWHIMKDGVSDVENLGLISKESKKD